MEKNKKFRSLEVRRKLIALKNPNASKNKFWYLTIPSICKIYLLFLHLWKLIRVIHTAHLSENKKRYLLYWVQTYCLISFAIWIIFVFIQQKINFANFKPLKVLIRNERMRKKTILHMVLYILWGYRTILVNY